MTIERSRVSQEKINAAHKAMVLSLRKILGLDYIYRTGALPIEVLDAITREALEAAMAELGLWAK